MFFSFSDQPTISQSSSNVVDGINLEDIKEFAKAFKLRRLGLGLTQTQVGQALSVTEGPAYSQSAICRYILNNINLLIPLQTCLKLEEISAPVSKIYCYRWKDKVARLSSLLQLATLRDNKKG